MIKKITIILVIILVLTVGAVLLSNLGFLPGLKDLTSNPGSGTSSVWDYEMTGGKITLTKYNGKSSSPLIPAEIDGIPVAGLGKGLFSSKSRIKEITIPDSVVSLGSGVFENCTELNLVNLPSGLTVIPEKAFSGCTALKVIQIPYGIQRIGDSAFSGCTSLSYLTLPDTVEAVGNDAFLNCAALSEITISKNLRNVGSHAFQGTQWLSDQKNEFVIIGDQVLIKYNGIEESVTVPFGVMRITDAFEDNYFPMEIVLPDSLTAIGPKAFSGCRSLERINIPERVESIGDSAFRGCSHLNPITLPENLTQIGTAAFQSCSALERIIIPDGVRSLPTLVLANCEKLKTVQIPKSVERISRDAFSFSGVSDLRVFKGSAGEQFAIDHGYSYSYMQQSNESFIFQQVENGVQAVLYTGNQYNVKIPETLEGDPVTSISDIIFQHNYSVRSVELPSTITAISDYSFADMSELRSVVFPETLEKIGVGAFSNDAMLGEVVIPDSVTDIADDAFTGCPSLIIIASEDSYAYARALQLGIRVRDVLSVDTGDFTFIKPEGSVLVSGYIGEDEIPELPRTNEFSEPVSGVAADAFRGKAIRSLIIPDGYTVLGDHSFADLQGPLEITLPRSVADISADCFENSDVTIYGYNDSYAEDYARSHKIKFLVIFEWEL